MVSTELIIFGIFSEALSHKPGSDFLDAVRAVLVIQVPQTARERRKKN